MVRQVDDGAVWRRHAVSAAIIVAMIWAAAVYRPDRALRVAVGVTAMDLCVSTFVTGRDVDLAFKETIAPRPGLRWLAPFLHYESAPEKGVVQAWIGGVRKRAQWTPARGCQLLYGAPVDPKPARAEPASLSILPDIAGPAVAPPRSEALRRAMDALFIDTNPQRPRRVKAVVVLDHGHITAERYAPGYDVATPINGWSASKSVLNALVGVLVRDGKLDIHQPANLPLWRKGGDPRGVITPENLLRMTSGLSVDQDSSGFDVASQVLYDERDSVLASIHRPLKRPVGAEFHYSDAQTLILARLVQNLVVGTPESFLRFARREVFEPLGMTGVTISFDPAGTPLMSSYVAAPARSWARLGQLYLKDGMIGQVRVLPEGWVAFSKRSTLGGDYGAGFWTNAAKTANAEGRISAGLPADAFFASGNLGQRVYIIPSREVVVVRMGLTPDEPYGIAEDIRFIRAVLADQGK